jgi:hypothetical protein
MSPDALYVSVKIGMRQFVRLLQIFGTLANIFFAILAKSVMKNFEIRVGKSRYFHGHFGTSSYRRWECQQRNVTGVIKKISKTMTVKTSKNSQGAASFLH